MWTLEERVLLDFSFFLLNSSFFLGSFQAHNLATILRGWPEKWRQFIGGRPEFAVYMQMRLLHRVGNMATKAVMFH